MGSSVSSSRQKQLKTPSATYSHPPSAPPDHSCSSYKAVFPLQNVLLLPFDFIEGEKHAVFSLGFSDSHGCRIAQPLLTTPAAIVFGIAFLFFHVLSALFRRPRQNYNVEPL